MDAPRESPGPSTENRFQLWFRYNWDQAVVPAIFVVMVLTFYVLNPNYLSPVNIVNVLIYLVKLSFLALETLCYQEELPMFDLL